MTWAYLLTFIQTWNICRLSISKHSPAVTRFRYEMTLSFPTLFLTTSSVLHRKLVFLTILSTAFIKRSTYICWRSTCCSLTLSSLEFIPKISSDFTVHSSPRSFSPLPISTKLFILSDASKFFVVPTSWSPLSYSYHLLKTPSAYQYLSLPVGIYSSSTYPFFTNVGRFLISTSFVLHLLAITETKVRWSSALFFV